MRAIIRPAMALSKKTKPMTYPMASNRIPIRSPVWLSEFD
jgi:hypothetical protein